jgi:hypothetical protein
MMVSESCVLNDPYMKMPAFTIVKMSVVNYMRALICNS